MPVAIASDNNVAQETGGNLAAAKTDLDTLAGGVTSSKFQTNIAQVAGSTVATAATGIAKVGLTDGSGNAVTSTSNALDVNIKSGTSVNASVGTTNATAPSSATEIGIVDGSGKLQGASATNPVPVTGIVTADEIRLDLAPISQTVSAADTASTTTSGQSSQSILSGTPTTNSSANFVISGIDTVNVQISGTWSGTLNTEISFDSGTTWYTRGIHLAGTSYITSVFTANGAGNVNVAGLTNIRVRATAFTSGSATIKVVGSLNDSSVYIANAIKLSDATTPSQQLAISATGAVTVSGTVSIAGGLLSSFLLLGNGASSVITGYFYTGGGDQTGGSINYSVPMANGSQAGITLATAFGAAIPSNAVGFSLTSCSAPLWRSRGAATQGSDFTTNYANYYCIPAFSVGAQTFGEPIT